MFIPYFIALIMGLVSPSDARTSNCHSTTQVSTADAGTNGEEEEDTDTGGETGQTPPPKIVNP